MTKVKFYTRAAVLALLLAIGVSAAAVSFTPEEQEYCKSQGGCATLTKEALIQRFTYWYHLGKVEGAKSCSANRNSV